MTSGDNRLQRAERRALQRDDEKYLAQPLNLGPDPRSISAHVRHMVHLLSTPTALSPCADAISHVSELFSRTVPRESERGLACRRGCAYCCTQLVTVTAPEAFWVAAQIRRKPAVIAAMRAADEKTHGLSMEERLKSHIVCPLLEDDACSVYLARPIGCRGFVSLNVNACIATFVHGAEPNIPQPANRIDILYVCRMILYAALRLRRLKADAYELNAAVIAALAFDDGEARWLAGEDIFADVPIT